MAKNYMANIAKMFGVELGEEFVLNTGYGIRYKFTHDGLAVQCEKNGVWYRARDVEEGLLLGKSEIIKLPWKPEDGDKYFYVSWHYFANRAIFTSSSVFSTMSETECLRVDIGNCFKTRDEAEAQKYEVFKRLTGKDWHESRGKGYGSNEAD